MTNGMVLESAIKQLGTRVKFVSESISPQLATYYFNYENIAQYTKAKLQAIVDKLSLYYHKNLKVVGGEDVAHFGITMPNRQTSPLWMTNLDQPKDTHSINIGKDLGNKDVVLDFNEIPHLLVAGTTGSGKSILLKSLMYGMFVSIKPDNFDLIIIDPKRTEFSMFKGRNNVQYIDETVDAIACIENAVSEMEYRYNEMSKGNYNFRHLFIVIDEVADLMLQSRYEVEESIVRLAQKSRAAKIHLIVATQRPTVNIITGTIKVNIPNRICLKMASGVDSRTMLDTKGAEELLGRGDAILVLDGTTTKKRFQCAMITNEDINYCLYGGK